MRFIKEMEKIMPKLTRKDVIKSITGKQKFSRMGFKTHKFKRFIFELFKLKQFLKRLSLINLIYMK